MKEKYFIYNGKKYYSGTNIIIWWTCTFTKSVMRANAAFIEHDLSNGQYVVEIYGKQYFYSEDHFYKVLCSVIDNSKVNVSKTPKPHTFTDELNIDGLLIAWIWYIFIMAVGVIFYDRIAIWIFASVVFFNYRNNKLKEAGYK